MAGRGRDAYCEDKANDTRTIDEVLNAQFPLIEDGEPVPDIHLLGLVDRPADDALAILERAPIARFCRHCLDSAPLLFLRTNARAVPHLVRFSRDASWEDMDLLPQLEGILTPLVVPELLLELTHDNDDTRERAWRYLRRFANDLLPTIIALAKGADPSPLGFVEKKQERGEDELPAMSLPSRARHALSILARTGHDAAREWLAAAPILGGYIPNGAPKMPKRIVPERVEAIRGVMQKGEAGAFASGGRSSSPFKRCAMPRFFTPIFANECSPRSDRWRSIRSSSAAT